MKREQSKEQAEQPVAGPVTESTCHACGSRVHQGGANVGQCINPRCKAEHTVINHFADSEGLTWNEYKDYYG